MFRLQGFETDIWSGAETRRAVALFKKLGARPGTIEKIAREMGRTTGSVAGHLRRRGLRVKEQREWTAREEKILLKYYGIETVGQIGDRIDRTADAVMRRANLLGLRWRVSPPWTPEDDARLRKLHARHGHDWAPIAMALGRFKVDVKQRATKLGLRRTVREWTPREDRLLRKLQPTTPYRELPKHFDRTIGAIRARIHQLGLGEEAARSWTPEEDAKLRKLFGTMPASKLAARFGRTGPAVSLRAAKLGLASEAPRRWTAKELELLAKLRRAGKSYEEIAGRLGRSVDAVHVRANKMKLNARG